MESINKLKLVFFEYKCLVSIAILLYKNVMEYLRSAQHTWTPLTVVTMFSYLLTFLNVVLIYRVKSTSLGYINLNPLTSNSHSLSNISVFSKVHRTGFGSCWSKALDKDNNCLYSFKNICCILYCANVSQLNF